MKTLIPKSTILWFSLVFMIIKTSVMAQSSFTLDASQMLTNFKFIDSMGVQDKSYSGNYSGAYSIGYRYSSAGGFLFRAGIGMRKAGATLVYDATNYSWDLQYADVKLGIGYKYDAGRIQPYLTVSPYYAFLLKANQRINNEDFDIKNSKSLQKTDYGIFISPGTQIRISDDIAAYAEFSYLMGLQNIETDAGQKGYNTAYALTVGVAFTIGSAKTSPKSK